MKLIFNQMLIEQVGLKAVQADKSYWAKVRLSGVWLKIEATHLRWKTANNCLDVSERVEMLQRNADVPLFFSTTLWIAIAFNKKPR